jgi:hypothetical protein
VNVTTHSRSLPWKYSNAKHRCQTVNLEYSKLTFWQCCFAYLYCAMKFSERLIRYVAYFRSLFKTSNQAGELVLNLLFCEEGFPYRQITCNKGNYWGSSCMQ